FDLAARRGCLRLIAGPEATDDALRLHQDARLHAGLFDGDEQAMLALAPGRRAYVHLARGALTVNDVVLAGGDALKLSDTPRLELRAASAAEVLVFDLPGAS
ncbi:MAG: quercetin 2,3-dioxygenase, partial [Gammaproteobacteria bacterium]